METYIIIAILMFGFVMGSLWYIISTLIDIYFELKTTNKLLGKRK